MAQILADLRRRLQSTSPNQLTSLVLGSVAFQCLAYYYGLRVWVEFNFAASKWPAPAVPPSKLRRSVSGLDLAKLTVLGFFYQDDKLKFAIVQQIVGAALMGHCLARGTASLLAAGLTFVGSLAATYLAWTPVVRLLALSTVVKEGDENASRHFLRVMMIQHSLHPHQVWTGLSYASVALLTVAMLRSLPMALSLPSSALYLAVNYL